MSWRGGERPSSKYLLRHSLPYRKVETRLKRHTILGEIVKTARKRLVRNKIAKAKILKEPLKYLCLSQKHSRRALVRQARSAIASHYISPLFLPVQRKEEEEEKRGRKKTKVAIFPSHVKPQTSPSSTPQRHRRLPSFFLFGESVGRVLARKKWEEGPGELRAIALLHFPGSVFMLEGKGRPSF